MSTLTVDTVKKSNNRRRKKRPRNDFDTKAYYRDIDFADDPDVYLPRIQRDDRINYWREVRKSIVQRKPPQDQRLWVDENRSNTLQVELKNYPRLKVFLIRVVTSQIWDYVYILFMGFFIYSASNRIIHKKLMRLQPANDIIDVPLLLLGGMVVCQLVPILSISYLVPCCNDLLRLLAQQNMGFWPVSAVLLAQYLEYTYYGGQDRAHLAGRSRLKNQVSSSSPKRRWWLSRDRDLTMDEDDITPKYRQKTSPAAKLFSMCGCLLWAFSRGRYYRKESSVHIEESARAASKADVVKGGISDSSPSDMYAVEESSISRVDEVKDLEAGTSDVSDSDPTLSVPEDGEGASMTTEDVGFLKRKRLEAEEAEARRREQLAEEKRQRDALVKEWREWRCLVCGKDQRQPAHKPKNYDIRFKQRGVRYVRDIAVLTPQLEGPQCAHCLTPADYKPPLGTAHLFPHNPHMDAAFGNYPKSVTVQAGVRGLSASTWFSRLLARVTAVCFGPRNLPDSLLISNDWRLPIYLASRFKEVPRPITSTTSTAGTSDEGSKLDTNLASMQNKGVLALSRSKSQYQDSPSKIHFPRVQYRAYDYFEVGETVECRLQRADWGRAKILVSRPNKSYDIQYDTGVEMRFVRGSDLRAPPLKGSLAYQTELCVVIVLATGPLGLAASFVGYPEFIMAPLLACSLWLFVLHLWSLGDHIIKHWKAGVLIVLGLRIIFIIPLFILLVAAAIPLQNYGWVSAAVAFSIAKFLSLPLLYIKRPSYALMGFFLFIQTSACCIAAAFSIESERYRGIPDVPLAPGITACLTLLLYRYWLGDIWDVSLRIRPDPDKKKGLLTLYLKSTLRSLFTKSSSVKKIDKQKEPSPVVDPAPIPEAQPNV